MDASKIVEDINAAHAEASRDTPGGREKLIDLAYSLAASLETPSETISRIGWAEPARFACVRIAVDLKIFEALSYVEDGKGLTVSQIAGKTNAEVSLISRIMKHLSAMNIVSETAKDTYMSNRLTNAFTEPKYRDGIIYTYDVAGPSFHTLPGYFSSINYTHPTSLVSGPFQHAHSTPLSFFAWLGENPRYLEAFNNYMSGYRQGKKSWMEFGFYPVKERLLSHPFGNDEVLLVDVGGGAGHDLVEFSEKLRSELHALRKGERKAKLVLQDRKEVVDNVDKKAMEERGIEVMEHDFFTEQTIKGARGYYLHSVLHDWPDEDCIKILQQLKPALISGESGKSKLLINEFVIPDTHAAPGATSMDWLMMALGAVKERTEDDWRRLLKNAGYYIEGIWAWEQGTESIIEATLVDT